MLKSLIFQEKHWSEHLSACRENGLIQYMKWTSQDMQRYLLNWCRWNTDMDISKQPRDMFNLIRGKTDVDISKPAERLIEFMKGKHWFGHLRAFRETCIIYAGETVSYFEGETLKWTPQSILLICLDYPFPTIQEHCVIHALELEVIRYAAVKQSERSIITRTNPKRRIKQAILHLRNSMAIYALKQTSCPPIRTFQSKKSPGQIPKPPIKQSFYELGKDIKKIQT